MKILCLTTFLDGAIRYEKDDQCTVSDEDGARFCAAGWARDLSGETESGAPHEGDAALDIQPLGHGQTSATL